MNYCLILLLCFFAQGEGEKKTSIEDAEFIQKASYSLGYQLGDSLKQEKVELDLDMLLKGISDGGKGEGIYTVEEMSKIVRQFQMEMVRLKRERHLAEMETRSNEAQSFMDANKNKPDVQSLESGLQFKVLKDGEGRSPTINDRVKAHYRGTLTDGTEFDNSYKRGEPITFSVKGVVPGWTEALQLMKEGSKWELYIPPKLGYGVRGSGKNIPPNAALIFEIELVEVIPNQPAPKPTAPPEKSPAPAKQ